MPTAGGSGARVQCCYIAHYPSITARHVHKQHLSISFDHHSSNPRSLCAMFASRPNPKKAYKELRSNLLTFGTICVAIRLTPYILHLAQKASS